ncbi:MAG: hypothetical protein WC662_01460 [Candidatus Paceibacterota bacterium]|jgi:hypothetical protein
MKEVAPKQEQPITPEEFFAKMQILRVSKEQFFDLVKARYPEKTDEEILLKQGICFTRGGKTTALIRTDCFPEKYLSYIETHEKWEGYVSQKEGYNLINKSVHQYRKDKGPDAFSDSEKLLNEVNNYNYSFGHEYAIYKEYEQAMKDGKLDEYHKWLMNFREQRKLSIDQKFYKVIENDTKIRESIYKKLKEGTKHSFLKS